jgi:hypothetical protein
MTANHFKLPKFRKGAMVTIKKTTQQEEIYRINLEKGVYYYTTVSGVWAEKEIEAAIENKSK